MFTQTFISTNTENDPALIPISEFALTDPTDTTASGFANAFAVYGAYRQFLTTAPGYVDSSISEVTPHRVTAIRVWESEDARNTCSVNLRANVALYTEYSALMDRFRTQYNVTTDPAPKLPPYYFP